MLVVPFAAAAAAALACIALVRSAVRAVAARAGAAMSQRLYPLNQQQRFKFASLQQQAEPHRPFGLDRPKLEHRPAYVYTTPTLKPPDLKQAAAGDPQEAARLERDKAAADDAYVAASELPYAPCCEAAALVQRLAAQIERQMRCNAIMQRQDTTTRRALELSKRRAHALCLRLLRRSTRRGESARDPGAHRATALSHPRTAEATVRNQSKQHSRSHSKRNQTAAGSVRAGRGTLTRFLFCSVLSCSSRST